MKSRLSLATLFTGMTIGLGGLGLGLGLAISGLITPAVAAPAAMVKEFSAAPGKTSQIVQVQNRYYRSDSSRRTQNEWNNRHYPNGYYHNESNRRPGTSARISPRHHNWCQNRYRTYRKSDNTFQPNHGPRRECWSPYS